MILYIIYWRKKNRKIIFREIIQIFFRDVSFFILVLKIRKLLGEISKFFLILLRLIYKVTFKEIIQIFESYYIRFIKLHLKLSKFQCISLYIFEKRIGKLKKLFKFSNLITCLFSLN